MSFIMVNEVEKKVEEVDVTGAVEEATAVLTQCLEERCGVRAVQPGMVYFLFLGLRPSPLHLLYSFPISPNSYISISPFLNVSIFLYLFLSLPASLSLPLSLSLFVSIFFILSHYFHLLLVYVL